MNAVRLLAAAVLACVCAHANAQEKKPAAAPRGIDKATAEAWANRGFEAGWMRELDGRLACTPEYPNDPRAMPAVWYAEPLRDLYDDDLKDLPATDVPFALILGHGWQTLGDPGIAHLATLANLKRLDVSGTHVTCVGLKPLAGLKHLATLRLPHTDVSDACLKHLAAFKNLTDLSLANTKVTDEGLKELAGLKNLTALNLDTTHVTDAGLKHLAGLTNLTELDLNVTNVSDAGLKHLAGMTNLTKLNLWMTWVEGKDLTPLAKMKKLTTFGVENLLYTEELLAALSEMGLLHALPNADVHVYGDNDRSVEGGRRPTRPEDVRSFRLLSRDATGEAVKYLACFPNLEYLYLGTEQVTPEGLKHAAGFKNLKSLSLESTTHAGDGLKHLAGMKKLAVLYVSGAELPREDVKRIAGIPTLYYLYVTVSDQTLQALHEAGALHKLWGATAAGGKRAKSDDEIVALDLSRTRVKGEGLKTVAKLKNLATLTLRDTPVSREALDDFRRALPKCEIVK